MTERVLVDGDTFFVTDEQFRTGGAGGLYHRDTRYLSEFDVSLADTALTPVGSDLVAPWRRVITAADVSSAVNELGDDGEQKHTSVAVTRDQVVVEGMGLAERLRVTNHSPTEQDRSLSVGVAGDFSDLFEVRGLRSGIERTVERTVEDDGLQYRYAEPGVDGDGSTLYVDFDPAPTSLSVDRGTYDVTLAPQASTEVTVTALVEGAGTQSDPFECAVERPGWQSLDRFSAERFTGSGYADVFAQAWRDLQALVTDTAHGPVAVAGVPWFATVFGRDALLTAFNALHVAPTLATGTLRYLAAHQGTAADAYREEEPGKIFHEIRRGELARRDEIPHTPYYGTVDATPLWLILLDETRRWTGTDAIVDDLWEHAEAAASWLAAAIDDIGDDPFLYYTASGDDGLAHKAWRDTERSVQFEDGEPADPPLASVEVQGYVYDAFRRTAALASDRGQHRAAREYEQRADALEARFDDEFWLPEHEYYGAAKTSTGRVVASRTSNVGHALWTGIIPDARADAVVDTLLGDGLYSGWGVRTMSDRDDGYSPVSYHVGSVWPHDNALIALGARQYGFPDAAERIATDVLDACRTFEHGRVPELYCGFGDEYPPYQYPSACEPQAWSASAPFAFLRALFDIRPGEDGRAVANASPRSVDIRSDAAVPVADGRGGTE